MSTIDSRQLDQMGGFRDPLIALGLALGPVVALGFSRFAYALLLPAMRSDLAWTYVQAGAVNTANAIGYIAGAITAAWLSKRLGARDAFVGTLLISALALIFSGFTADYWTLLLIRVIGGYTTAVTFVIGSVLAAQIRSDAGQHRSAMLLALYFAGVGIGIVISGVAVPAVLSNGDSQSWQAGWLVLGVVAAGALLPATVAAFAVRTQGGRPSSTLRGDQVRGLAPILVSYLLFGAGYVSYMTFIIALLQEQHVANWIIAIFWILLGSASALSSLAWGPILGRLWGGKGAAIVAVIAALGTLPVLLWPGTVSAISSAVVFGGSFMAGPTAVTLLARRSLPQTSWAAGIAWLTVAFALGQAVGPIASGMVTDQLGTVSSGLWLSPALLLISAAIALLSREQATAPSPELSGK